jgi:NAD(P)-dependent dehydrogenase (short-subunit alcohol dehydrogenase family)
MTASYFENLYGLAGKTALVTGGASGIGEMVTEALASAGARVLISSRKADVCEALAERLNGRHLPGRVEAFAGDVGSEAGVKALAAETGARTQALHILVNNAGRTWGTPLGSFPHRAWNDVLSVNLAGTFALTQEVLPLLRAAASANDPARVVNLGSVMGTQPISKGAYSYSASKAAVHHITRILANELASEHITVNAFAPGPFDSRMMAFATRDAEKRARMERGIPIGRIGRAEDIAAALLFLCGRGGAYTTGAIIPIDGGLHVVCGGGVLGGDD